MISKDHRHFQTIYYIYPVLRPSLPFLSGLLLASVAFLWLPAGTHKTPLQWLCSCLRARMAVISGRKGVWELLKYDGGQPWPLAADKWHTIHVALESPWNRQQWHKSPLNVIYTPVLVLTISSKPQLLPKCPGFGHRCRSIIIIISLTSHSKTVYQANRSRFLHSTRKIDHFDVEIGQKKTMWRHYLLPPENTSFRETIP